MIKYVTALRLRTAETEQVLRRYSSVLTDWIKGGFQEAARR
jgi:hypothetical protein